MNSLKKFIKDYKSMLFVYAPVVFVLFFVGFMLVSFPEKAAQGVKDGLNISFNVLIPSMYVFMVFSGFVVETGIISKFAGKFTRVFERLFDMPSEAFFVMILSAIGGYPVGPQCTVNLFQNGTISRNHAKKLLLCAINPSPAFVIGTVGSYMLQNKNLGGIIYVSTVLTSVIMMFVLRFVTLSDENYLPSKTDEGSVGLAQGFVNSVKKGASGMINICSFVILFSCINSLIEVLNLHQKVVIFLNSILEVTNGCISVSAYLPVSAVAAVISFGGLCTFCQILPHIVKVRLDIKIYLSARILSAAISALICEGLVNILPISCETFSTSAKPEQFFTSSSVWVSVGLIILTSLFILGDDYIIKRERVKIENNNKKVD